MPILGRVRAALGGVLGFLLVIGTLYLAVAQTAPSASRRTQPHSRSMDVPTPPVMTMAPQLDAAARVQPPRKPPPAPAFGRGKHRAIRSASGATILLSSIATACYNPNDADTTVFLASANCTLQWQASGLNAEYPARVTADTFQDYAMAPGAVVATAIGTTYTATSQGVGTLENATLSIPGVYVFGTYDVTANEWIALLYVEVAPPAAADTFNDSQLAQQAETFVGGTDTVYVKATGLTPGDYYALGVENNSANGQCVYIAPHTTATSLVTGPTYSTTGTAHLCDLSTANVPTGQQASGNTLTFSWPVPADGTKVAGFAAGSPSMKNGTYAIYVYDVTTQKRVAERSVSVYTASSGLASLWLQFSSNVGTIGDPAPAPTPPLPVVRVAWNGTAGSYVDTSVNQVTLDMGAANLTSSRTYRWTLTDPSGTVVYTSPNASGITSATPKTNAFALPNPAAVDFGKNYPSATWTVALFALGATPTTTPAPLVAASRAIRIQSYASSVSFTRPVVSTLIDLGGSFASGGTTGILYTNIADQVFGAANGDPIREFKTTFPAVFSSISIPVGTGTCIPFGAQPCTTSATDSTNHAWTVTLACGAAAGNACDQTQTYTLDAVPTSSVQYQSLAPGATLDIEGLTVQPVANSCTAGCNVTNQIYPRDGYGLSGGTRVANNLQFVNNGNIPNTTADIAYYGYRQPQPSSGTPAAPTLAKLPPGYTARQGGVVLSKDQPFSQSGNYFVFKVHVLDDNNYSSSNADSVKALAIALPPGFDKTTVQVRQGSATAGAISNIACSTTTANGNNVCVNLNPFLTTTQFSTNNGKTGYANSTDLYVDVAPPPNSFSWTDAMLTVTQSSLSSAYGVKADNAAVATLAGTPSTVDSLALAAYSVNGKEMVGQLNPTTIGTSHTSTVTLTVQNTTTALDPNPDYLDMLAVQIPAGNASISGLPTACTGVTVNTANWTCAGVGTSGSTTLWFTPVGCTGLYLAGSDFIPPNATSVGYDPQAVPSGCTFVSALAPGATFSAAFPITTTATPTATGAPVPIVAAMHGVSTGAWSVPVSSGLTVSAVSSSAGFSNAGPYTTATPTPVAVGAQPQTSGDTDATNGNSYVYTVNNTGITALTGATITIPGPDTSGASGIDSSGRYWYVTSASLGTSTYGCTLTVNNVASNKGGTQTGSMVVGGSSCSIPTNGVLSVRFNAKAPALVNHTFSWPTTVTYSGGSMASVESWINDSTVAIVLSASLVLTPVTTAACTYLPAGALNTAVGFNVSTETIDFGQMSPNTTDKCLSAVKIAVFTNASTPVGWKLYAEVDGNPATAGSPPSGLANEIAIATSATNTTTGINVDSALSYGTTAVTVAPVGTGGGGFLLSQTTGTGPSSPKTTSYDTYMDLQIGLGSEIIAPGNSHNFIFTWVSS